MSRPPYATDPKDRPVQYDTLTQRPVNEDIPLADCARYAEIHAGNLIVREHDQRRVNEGLPPGGHPRALPDPVAILEADAFAKLAAMARAIDGHEEAVRALLQRRRREARKRAEGGAHE